MITYTVSLFLTKVSIMLQYLRIFLVPKFRIWLWMSLGIVIAYGLITTSGKFDPIPCISL